MSLPEFYAIWIVVINLSTVITSYEKFTKHNMVFHGLSAIIDLGYKCSFFSGLVENNEGLYYARVDQVASHIVALAEKHKEG